MREGGLLAKFFRLKLLIVCISLDQYQGDIKLTREQQYTLEATSNPSDIKSPQKAIFRSSRNLWPNGVVPYLLDRSLNSKVVDIGCSLGIYTILT